MTDHWLLLESGAVVDGDTTLEPNCIGSVRNSTIPGIGSVDRSADVPRGSRLAVICAQGRAIMPELQTLIAAANVLPHEYGWESLSYERAFEGFPVSKTQLNRSRDQCLEVVNEVRKYEKVGAATGPAAGCVNGQGPEGE
ncbi:hypothetical protein C6A87_000535 [Mycobacterium sp. ITM-2016-00317]|uniref:hypothetical protein n=1 Tax=Mycobacterium sp. ITM-2016-00317 TaxID=2099694 RepID=UPI000D469902|nr:hypothetical protein [Mycobacterium sp. ITM-2016-00317]WNG87816.1 hypothetical protein C6A87_000535 [Mycobacterium sp. ITM-2016-00317]